MISTVTIIFDFGFNECTVAAVGTSKRSCANSACTKILIEVAENIRARSGLCRWNIDPGIVHIAVLLLR